jgi:short subunit dehydrogenase-like uncharacterized protein
MAASGIGRRIIKGLLPKPGEGPSEKVMDGGFFQCEFVAVAKNGKRLRGIIQGQGDAGNRITVKCLCESAFVLAQAQMRNTDVKPLTGGVLTPVTGLGEALVGRLAKAGISFKIVSAQTHPEAAAKK